MKRLLTSLLCALVLAAIGSFAYDTARGPEHTAALAAKSFKTCKAKTEAGKTKTWRCGSDQACCVNPFMKLYVCGYPGLGCL